MLTNTDGLRARLEAARAREKAARAEAARIAREMAAADRRRETQRLCVLGRAWLAWAERNEAFRSQAGRFLAGYVTRETDREALRGSPFDLPSPAEHAEAPAEGALAEHGEGANG